MQANLSVLLLVVVLCAIYNSCGAQFADAASLRRLEEEHVRDEFDATAALDEEAPPTKQEYEAEPDENEFEEDLSFVPEIDPKETEIMLDENDPNYNVEDIDVVEKEDPSLIHEGTKIQTDFSAEDIAAEKHAIEQEELYPDGVMEEESSIELDGTEDEVEPTAEEHDEGADHYLEEDEEVEDPEKLTLASHFALNDEIEDEEEPEVELDEEDLAQKDLTPEHLSAIENEVDPDEDTIDEEGTLNEEESQHDDEENNGEVGAMGEEITFDDEEEDDVPEADVEDEKVEHDPNDFVEWVPEDESMD